MYSAIVGEVITLTLVYLAYAAYTVAYFGKIKNKSIYTSYPSTLMFFAVTLVSLEHGFTLYPVFTGLLSVATYFYSNKLMGGLASALLAPLILYIALIALLWWEP
ncbi:MAG: hypothetical protein JHC12_02630 [Thermogladius sp.]|jgi:hypothetical protein|nr:hypothetical protein [Thermogladius sp.]